MANLFLFLFFVSFVCLILGLIKPSVFNRFTNKELSRKKVGLIFGTTTIVSLFLIGVFAEPVEKPEEIIFQNNEEQLVDESILPAEGKKDTDKDSVETSSPEKELPKNEPQHEILSPALTQQTNNEVVEQQESVSQIKEEVLSTGNWYTSSHSTAKYYYHESCQGWQGLSPSYLKVFNSETELLNKYKRTLHPDCNPK